MPNAYGAPTMEELLETAKRSGDYALLAILTGEEPPKTTKPTVDKSKFLDSLIKLRLRRGLTQSDLAAKLGMPQSSLARVESGKANPTIDTLLKIAAGLDAGISLQPRR